MTNRVSPFAALTGAEKQIKWLEYQSVRLPYIQSLSLIHISEPTRQAEISYAVFCLKKKKEKTEKKK